MSHQNNNNDNDSDWDNFIKGIKKMPQPKVPEKPIPKPKDIRPNVDLTTVYTGDKLSDLEFNNTDNIDNKTAQKFRKNEFKIEATLDLHGYTEDKAFEEVNTFIKSSYIKGLRCILIITGKGLHQEDDSIFSPRAVLKNKVPQWLNLYDLRPLILSFTHPSQKLGGEGALYILLRRKRN